MCLYYLSFSFVTRHYLNQAKEVAQGDVKVEQDYIDSLSNTKVWLWSYTLKECREMEIGLGLDLKGGMNVILEVSVPDVIRLLADNKTDEKFTEALNNAAKLAVNSQDDVITLFIKEYHRLAPGHTLAELFATQQLKDKVNQKSSDAEVEKVLREEVKAAVDNSFNVLRTRIDRFGVVQPNIQSLEDKMGRIQKASQEKMQAISDKMLGVIKEIGQAGNYVYIMDVTAGVPYISTTLSTDVTAEIKKKLGLQ